MCVLFFFFFKSLFLLAEEHDGVIGVHIQASWRWEEQYFYSAFIFQMWLEIFTPKLKAFDFKIYMLLFEKVCEAS